MNSACKSVPTTVILLGLGFLYKSIKSSFFFFQAEDGIRDLYVTGVQTCALPISRRRRRTRPSGLATSSRFASVGTRRRSEERRVGKECRSRWSKYGFIKIPIFNTCVVYLSIQSKFPLFLQLHSCSLE